MADDISTGRRGAWRRIAPWFLLSLLIHIAVLYELSPLFQTLKSHKEKEEAVRVSVISPTKHTVKNRTIHRKRRQKKPQRTKALRPNKQVVDIARPKQEHIPDDYRFLSQYNSSVKKQTRSKSNPKIRVRGNKLQETGNNAQKRQTAIAVARKQTQEVPARREIPEVKKSVKKESKSGFDGNRGSMARGDLKKKNSRSKTKGLSDKTRKEVAFVAGHKVERRFLPSSSGSLNPMMSPSNDLLKDISLGDETAINTKRFLYADYYNRIKRAVSYYWSPTQAILVNDPNGSIYGRQDRFTKLKAVIGAEGKLLSLKVVKSSGVDVLDREAMEAFAAAAPFPNPPKALLNDKRQFVFQLGFYVYMR